MSDRPTIRCAACRLNQFMTAYGYCRKCRAPLVKPVSGPCEEVDTVPMSVRIASRLATLREARGFSQEALSAAARCHRVTVAKIETLKYSPRMETLETLAAALGVHVDVLFSSVEEFTRTVDAARGELVI